MSQFMLIFSTSPGQSIQKDYIQTVLPVLSELDLRQTQPEIVISSPNCLDLAKRVHESLGKFFHRKVELPTVSKEKFFFNVRNEIMNIKPTTRLIILIGHWEMEELMRNMDVEIETSFDPGQFIILDRENRNLIFESPVFT